MNSNPYAVPAIVAGAVMIIACITGLLWVSYAQRPAAGRHARHPEPVPFADPADTSDPDGAGYVGQLTEPPAGPAWPDEDEPDAGWWAQHAPPPAVEVLTGPDRRIAQTAQLTLGVLERVRDRLLEIPPDGTTATFTPAPGVTMPASDDPDTTGVQPHAVTTWGKTAAALAEELAAKYLAAPNG